MRNLEELWGKIDGEGEKKDVGGKEKFLRKTPEFSSDWGNGGFEASRGVLGNRLKVLGDFQKMDRLPFN